MANGNVQDFMRENEMGSGIGILWGHQVVFPGINSSHLITLQIIKTTICETSTWPHRGHSSTSINKTFEEDTWLKSENSNQGKHSWVYFLNKHFLAQCQTWKPIRYSEFIIGLIYINIALKNGEQNDATLCAPLYKHEAWMSYHINRSRRGVIIHPCPNIKFWHEYIIPPYCFTWMYLLNHAIILMFLVRHPTRFLTRMCFRNCYRRGSSGS